ncbi:hypothetical protein WDW86_19250 [Bdellovibrionota bacterium FG-2]
MTISDDLQSKASEIVKKVLTVGIGAIFLTEESVRAMVSEFKLPKELLHGVLESASKTKNEFLQNISQDIVSKFVDRIEPAALVEEFLAKHVVEFNVKMSFSPKPSTHEKSGARHGKNAASVNVDSAD